MAFGGRKIPNWINNTPNICNKFTRITKGRFLTSFGNNDENVCLLHLSTNSYILYYISIFFTLDSNLDI